MTGSAESWSNSLLLAGFDSANIARELNRRDLHSEAKAEIGNIVFARKLGRADFPFHAALAEAAGNKNASDIGELAV